MGKPAVICRTVNGPKASWTSFCLQNCLNSSWQIFNQVLKGFIRDYVP